MVQPSSPGHGLSPAPPTVAFFKKKTVPDIVKEIFREHGYTDFQKFLAGELYRPWNYCVQYRETDFAFISRLMEQEGIYYYFKHESPWSWPTATVPTTPLPASKILRIKESRNSYGIW